MLPPAVSRSTPTPTPTPDVIETDHTPQPALVLESPAAPSNPTPLPLLSDHVSPPAVLLNAAAAQSPRMPLLPRNPAPMEPQPSCELALQTHDCNDGGNKMEIHPPPINMDGYSTPKKRAAIGPFCGSSCTPECEEELKPIIGMTFESMEVVEEFYKAYAHTVGFSVRIGQKKTVDNVVVLYDSFGNLLEENESSSLDLAKRKMVSEIHQTLDDTIRLAEHSPEELEALRNSLFDMKRNLSQRVAANNPTRQDEFEAYIGCTMPNQVEIHPPTDVRTKGRCKRIKGHLDKGGQHNKDGEAKRDQNGEGNKHVGGQKKKVPRTCKKCKQVGFHDSRNCPNNN